MDKEYVTSVSFQLVAHVGQASAFFDEAIAAARNGRFDDAEVALKQADQAIVEAHHTQTELLRAEVEGEQIEFSLLLVHAQDHLMTTITFGRLAREIIELYREVKHEH